MKFQVAAMAEKAINAKGGDDSIVVLVGIPEGTFVVNYLNGTAEFFKKVGLESVVISLAKNLDTKVVVELSILMARLGPTSTSLDRGKFMFRQMLPLKAECAIWERATKPLPSIRLLLNLLKTARMMACA